MKRILIASAVAFAAGGQALAADLSPPPMAPLPRAPAMYVPVAPVYNWSGFYIGGNLGAGWNSGRSVSDTFGSTFTGSGQTTKFLGGGQVGVNYEFGGGVVIGAEATFDWLPNTTNTWTATGAGAATGSTASATFTNRLVTTATGKLGYAWDRLLVYGKGGGAWIGATILASRSMALGLLSIAVPPTISAGLRASGLSGHLPAIGQREPNTTILGCKTKA
jgi:outer membrane immunogenic protein